MTNYEGVAYTFYGNQGAAELKTVIESKMHERVHSLRPNAKTGIDIGCGNGHILEFDPRFEGLETSPDMIAQASLAIRGRIHWGNIVTGKHIAVLYGKYDIASANYVLMEWTKADIERAAQHIFALLRPGGLFACSLTHPAHRTARYPGHRAIFSRQWEYDQIDEPMRIEFDSPAGYIDMGLVDYHNPIEVYQDALAQAGFRHIRTEDIFDVSGRVRALNRQDVPFGLLILAERPSYRE